MHFVPLAFVFGQSLLIVAALLLTAAAIAAFFAPARVAAPSFWCGIAAAPVLVALGVVALWGGHQAV